MFEHKHACVDVDKINKQIQVTSKKNMKHVDV